MVVKEEVEAQTPAGEEQDAVESPMVEEVIESATLCLEMAPNSTQG